MAYFSNSTDGAAFEYQCSRCKLNDASCPIAAVQFNYNYDAVNNEVATKILGGLVKDNGQCLMYAEIEKAWDGKPVASTASKCNKHIVSHCACSVDETTGWTQVKCCNICGKPLKDQNWHCG